MLNLAKQFNHLMALAWASGIEEASNADAPGVKEVEGEMAFRELLQSLQKNYELMESGPYVLMSLDDFKGMVTEGLRKGLEGI